MMKSTMTRIQSRTQGKNQASQNSRIQRLNSLSTKRNWLLKLQKANQIHMMLSPRIRMYSKLLVKTRKSMRL